MTSKIKVYVFSLSLLVATAVIGATILKPQRTYKIEDNRLSFQLRSAPSPLQPAQALLQQLAYLPPAQDLPQCFEVDPAHLAGVSSTPAPGSQITEVKFTAVHLSSFASLLLSILDDDPIVQADIEGLAVTADGSQTPFTTSAWDYGLLTPWSLHHKGDGWKLFKVCYGQQAQESPAQQGTRLVKST